MKVLATPLRNDESYLRLEFKAEDCWVGLFWRWERLYFHAWVCLLPCLPIHVCVRRPREP